MLKIEKKDIKHLILFFTLGTVYAVLYYIIFDFTPDTLVYALGQIIMASILLTYFFATTARQLLIARFSVVGMMLWLVAIYYYISVIRYPTSFHASSGFSDDPLFRFGGSVIIFLGIFLAMYVNREGLKKNYFLLNYRVDEWILWVYIIILAYYKLISYNAVYSVNHIYESNDIISLVVVNSINAIFVGLAIQHIQENTSKSNVSFGVIKGIVGYRGFMPLVAILTIYFLGSLLTGQRSTMFIPILQAMTLLLMRGVIKSGFLVFISSIVPLAYIGYSLLAFHISGRLGNSSRLYYAKILGYRCDLSDLPNEIAANTVIMTRNFSRLIYEGFLNMIPSFWGIDKSSFQRGGGGAYDQLMASAGLTTADYGSNVFAMGASVAGYFGIGIALMLLVLFEKKIEKIIITKSKTAIFSVTILAYYYIGIEISWINFFIKILWCVISLVICMVTVKLLRIMGILRFINT